MLSHAEISPIESQRKALEFIAQEWALSPSDREWLAVLTVRPIGESWYVVELGVEGLPDKWVVQVYDTGECDPDYTFMSPIATLDTPGIGANLHSLRGAGQVTIAIGPEGDWTPEEIQLAVDRGAQQVGLGPLVLRLETAALAAVSAIILSVCDESVTSV